MTHEQMQELTELRQYQRDTDIYVQKMEERQDYYLRVIRNQAKELAAKNEKIERLMHVANIRKCPVCGRMIGLTAANRFRRHGERNNACEGSWAYVPREG